MRHNFSLKTKKAARMRSGGVCEAVGTRYGYAPGERCTAILSETSVEFDHYPLGAHAEGSNTLENCVCACKRCNQWAANHTDKRIEAKIKRIVRANGPLDLRRKKIKIPQWPDSWPKGQKLQSRKFGQ